MGLWSSLLLFVGTLCGIFFCRRCTWFLQNISGYQVEEQDCGDYTSSHIPFCLPTPWEHKPQDFHLISTLPSQAPSHIELFQDLSMTGVLELEMVFKILFHLKHLTIGCDLVPNTSLYLVWIYSLLIQNHYPCPFATGPTNRFVLMFLMTPF